MKLLYILMSCLALTACSSAKSSDNDSTAQDAPKVVFDADSAYAYVARQVAFGPRVPNTDAHRQTAQWLADELKRHGADVSLQHADLTAYDGTVLKSVNIIGQFNPEADNRLALVAHWDCRPYADKDKDAAMHKRAVDGANDGASGVGVLLEIARILGSSENTRGIDIVFVDAEDWGDYDDDDSWALGTRYFVNNPFKEGYRPSEAIVLDMVGGKDARFHREYLSQTYHPRLVQQIWDVAKRAGFATQFPQTMGGAVTDDHMEFIKAGIPAIDIIDFDPEEGFCRQWHTTDDTMDNIDRETLRAVGQTMVEFLLK